MMKIRMSTILSISAILSMILSTVNVYAIDQNDNDTESSDETTEYYTMNDGTVIAYSSTAMNGGIDWNGVHEEEASDNSDVDAELLSTASNSIPESVVITVPFQMQQNNYYCGPAAARMVLGAIGCYRTQDQLAALLGTTSSAGTPAGDSVADALNSVCAGTGFRFTWEWHSSRDYSTIKGHITEALSYGNPVMVNTWESTGDCYIQGHEGYDPLYHYGVVADYFDYGNEETYTDPGAGRFEGFLVDQRITLENLSKACGGRGYAW